MSLENPQAEWVEVTTTDPNNWDLIRYQDDFAVLKMGEWAKNVDGSFTTEMLISRYPD